MSGDERGTRSPPKHLEVKNRIETAIRQGNIVDKLPGERVLAKQYGVSYMTLRKSVDSLVADGLLYRIPQMGTYVHVPGKADFADKPRRNRLRETMQFIVPDPL